MSHGATVQLTHDLHFLEAGVTVERRPDSSMVLPHRGAVSSRRKRCCMAICGNGRWARPHQTFLAERSADGSHWQTVSYSGAYDAAARLATAFVAKPLRPERPILILSGNGITHQLVALAAVMAGIPYTRCRSPIRPRAAISASSALS